MDLTPEQLDAMEKAVAYYSRKFRLENADATQLDIAELEQEARIHAWRRLPSMKDTRHFRAFISRAVYFAYCQFSRRYKRYRSHYANVDIDDCVCVRRSTARETARAIVEAVDGIGNARNRAMCKAYLGGVSQTQLAREYGLSRARISQVLHESLRPIWLRLKDDEI